MTDRSGSSKRKDLDFRRMLAIWNNPSAAARRPPLSDPATIPDREVVEHGGPRLVTIKCKPCGSGIKGVRKMDDGRVVIGAPWLPLEVGGLRVFPLTCQRCGSRSSIGEGTVLDAVKSGRSIIRVGSRQPK